MFIGEHLDVGLEHLVSIKRTARLDLGRDGQIEILSAACSTEPFNDTYAREGSRSAYAHGPILLNNPSLHGESSPFVRADWLIHPYCRHRYVHARAIPAR